MSSTDKPAPLDEAAAREAVNRWSKQGFFRLPHMGDKIFVDEIVPSWAYRVRLQTHYERRKVERIQQPYHSGPVDDRGLPPEPWDIPVKRPGPFEERTERLPVPHTEHVQMCGGCAGEGRVVCPQCQGVGQVRCSTCGGTGMVESKVMEPGRDAQGNAVQVARVEHRPCTCADGRVRCGGCAGHGLQTCGGCAGSGRVKTFDQLVVSFDQDRHGDLLDPTPVPDGWFLRLTGEVVADEKARQVDHFPPVPEEIDRRVRDLLHKAQAVDEKEARLLLQHLCLERVPLHEVRYRYAGQEEKLWVCGNEREVYAPGAPWNRSRLLRLIGGIVGGAVGVVLLIVLLILLFGR